MALANVISTKSGTNFTVNVAAANLSDDVTEKDFVVLHNGTAVSNVNYNKTTPVTLTYVGAALPSTTIEIRRKTSFDQAENLIPYANRFSTEKWNEALLRIQRWEEEVDLNGSGSIGAGVIPTPANDPYGAVWTNDTVYPPTRKAVWDKIETLAPKASPALTGTPTAPTAAFGTNTTQIATTKFVKDVLGNAPAVTNPTVSNGSFNTPTIATPAITGGTLSSAAISGGTLSNTVITNGTVDGTTGTSYGGIVSNSNVLISHVDVYSGLNARLMVAASKTTANNTYVANVYQILEFSETVLKNVGSIFNPSLNRITPAVTGWYRISGYWSVSCTGGTPPTALRIILAVYGNGAGEHARVLDLTTSVASHAAEFSHLTPLTVGSYYDMRLLVIPNGGSGYSITAPASGANQLRVEFVSN